MTQYTPTFNPQEFELRDYTSQYFTPTQSQEVSDVEARVNGELDFVAQMLGWNGPNYWSSLATTVSQKRQLLGGTFGVYNSFVIPRVYEIRNWDNTFVVDRLQFVAPNRQTYVEQIVLGDDVYRLRGVSVEGDKYIISIGELPQSFYDQIAANVQLRVDIPTYRTAPFRRVSVGASGDNSFVCAASGSNLQLYPSWDTTKQFEYKFPILFAGSVYYFNQPVYLVPATTLLGTPNVLPQYDPDLQLWYLQIPEELTQNQAGIEGTLYWNYSDPSTPVNATLLVKIQAWYDPSDWNSINVLENYRGAWNNKGGALPFNLAFDSLSIHGFSEQNSFYVNDFSNTLDFNAIVNLVYAQTSIVYSGIPGVPYQDQFWWNQATGVLSYWNTVEPGCEEWVQFNYRVAAISPPPPAVVYPDVVTFIANSPSLPIGAVVQVQDINGLAIAQNVLGLQGTIVTPGALTLYRADSSPYWTPTEFTFANVSDFADNSRILPFKVPVIIQDATGLAPSSATYNVQNLSITVPGAYEAVLQKYYNNLTWEIEPDSVLKYIAESSLFNGPFEGEMWWDYANPNPVARIAATYVSSASPIAALTLVNPGVGLTNGVYLNVPLIPLSAAMSGANATADITVAGNTVTAVTLNNPGQGYEQGDALIPDPTLYPMLVGCVFEVSAALADAWIDVNTQATIALPPNPLNMGVILFYCDGNLLADGVPYDNDNFTFAYTSNPATGKYEFSYTPKNLTGKTQYPTITITDNITTAYRADITNQVFSNYRIYMSPNVYDSEVPLRLWKGQDLQDAETVAHLAEDNYINPLIADQNNGPGPENWERYFVRLPLDYGRTEEEWQKSTLICQDFGYWGSTIQPEKMRCPPEDDAPAIYEELFLYDQPVPDYTYVYCEPYLYSNIAYFNSGEVGIYRNSGIFPATDVQFDDFNEAELIEYEPLHNRQADVTSPVNKGYGDWLGDYVNINPCIPLTGFFTTDLVSGGIEPVLAPVWDASIYKFAPTCENDPESYSVDSNHYKIGYAYFVADASAAEDGFFDPQQEAAWRFPVTQPKTLYVTPR
jgi:hypothetical protein